MAQLRTIAKLAMLHLRNNPSWLGGDMTCHGLRGLYEVAVRISRRGLMAQRASRIWKAVLAPAGRREGLWLAVALALISCLPVLVAARPQMTDYPSHLARWFIMLDGGHSPWLARYYQFHWRWSGNLGVDLLIIPLAKLMGLEPAGRLVAGVIPPLTGLAMICVEWTLHRRIGLGTMFALATIWSPLLILGLLNYALAVALALFAFAGWVRLEDWRWRWLIYLPIGMVVWLCHLAGWGVLGVLVLAYEMSRRPGLAGLLAPWPLALPVMTMVGGGGGGAPLGLLAYGDHIGTYKLSIWFMALRDHSWWLDIDTLGLLVAACILAAVLRRFDKRLGWAAAAFAALSLVLPRHLGGGDYTDYRLIAVALTAGSLAIDWSPPRFVLWLAAAPYLVRLALTTTVWQADSREVEIMLHALDPLPRGTRVAAAVVMERAVWATDTFQHVPSYATLWRDALVNTHFAEPGVHMLQLREGGPEFKDPSQRILLAPGEPVDLANFVPAQGMDYLWYIGGETPATLPPGAQVIYRTRRSLMARLAKPAASR